MDRCVCPEGTTQSEDGWSCLLADGGVITHPGAPSDASLSERADGGRADSGCEDGEACVTPGGGPGICRAGACFIASCGNAVVDTAEECDDGRNGDDDDGCTDECRWTCERNADCDDDDGCNGQERCALASHTCVTGTRLDCDDGDNCTDDSCDSALGCVNSLIDADGDGFAPTRLGVCSSQPSASRDCDDESDLRFPGATDACDGIDNDCDVFVDENAALSDCFRDADRDGYPNPLDRVQACRCPDGFIQARADRLTDCADFEPGANPAASAFQSVPYALPTGGSSFDWNCDGAIERGVSTTCRFDSAAGRCSGGAWSGETPACGQVADYCGCIGTASSCWLGICDVSIPETCR
jgi:hypothetical protein